MQTQLLVMCGAMFTALIGVMATAVGALCYFLRRLIHTTIPEQGERFERVVMAQLRESEAHREQCRQEHESQERKATERHQEVMTALDRRPFRSNLEGRR